MKRTGYECFECGGVVGFNAKTCPHCHAEFDSELFGRSPRFDKQSRDEADEPMGMFGYILCGIGVIFALWIVTSILGF